MSFVTAPILCVHSRSLDSASPNNRSLYLATHFSMYTGRAYGVFSTGSRPHPLQLCDVTSCVQLHFIDRNAWTFQFIVLYILDGSCHNFWSSECLLLAQFISNILNFLGDLFISRCVHVTRFLDNIFTLLSLFTEFSWEASKVPEMPLTLVRMHIMYRDIQCSFGFSFSYFTRIQVWLVLALLQLCHSLLQLVHVMCVI